MKNIGFIYSTDQRFEELIKANELSEHGEYLIRIHTCVHRYESIMDFANKILTYFPKAKIILKKSRTISVQSQKHSREITWCFSRLTG